MIIGCDFHPSWQQVSWLDTETGETGEKKLVHAAGEAKMFYQALAGPGLLVMEVTGDRPWLFALGEDPGQASGSGAAGQTPAMLVGKTAQGQRGAGPVDEREVAGRWPRVAAAGGEGGRNTAGGLFESRREDEVGGQAPGQGGGGVGGSG